MAQYKTPQDWFQPTPDQRARVARTEQSDFIRILIRWHIARDENQAIIIACGVIAVSVIISVISFKMLSSDTTPRIKDRATTTPVTGTPISPR